MKTALVVFLAAALMASSAAAQTTKTKDPTKDPTKPTTNTPATKTPARTTPAPKTAASKPADIKGTWSGNWTPKGGVPDSITIELRQEGAKVSGKFVTPMPLEFSKVSYFAATGAIVLEAADAAGKVYKIDGKIQGTELKGTITIKDQVGEARLIKWTYFPR